MLPGAPHTTFCLSVTLETTMLGYKSQKSTGPTPVSLTLTIHTDDVFTQQQHDRLNSINQALTAKRVRDRAGLEAERSELLHLKLKSKNAAKRITISNRKHPFNLF